MALSKPVRAFNNCPADADGKLLTTASRIGEFWTMFGIELDDEEAHADIKGITKDLKLEGCITVGSMLELSRNKIVTIVCKNKRGRAGWVPSIETLLDHSFARISDCAPESAHLGLSFPMDTIAEEDEPPVRHIEAFKPEFKLGARLLRRGLLNEIALPFDKMDAVIECESPLTERLSYNDTKAVAGEGFKYMATQHQYIAGDKIIFKHMAKQTSERYPTPWKGTWKKIYKNRFKVGR